VEKSFATTAKWRKCKRATLKELRSIVMRFENNWKCRECGEDSTVLYNASVEQSLENGEWIAVESGMCEDCLETLSDARENAGVYDE
jgi:hypothetical protein